MKHNKLNPWVEINQRIADHYVAVFVTAWFWPYFVMGNLDGWQKLGITLNGIKPMCTNRN